MRKIVNPCSCEVWSGERQTKFYNAFARIEYKDGRLSICGVVGPMSNGDCRGNAGQCVNSIRAGTPKPPWTAEMLQKFCGIWDRWHLNDMRPYCAHQKELGWDKEALEPIVLRHYCLTGTAMRLQRDAETAAMEALKQGETFTPTAEQQFFASLSYSVDTFGDLEEHLAPHYEPKKSLWPGDAGPTETLIRGHVWCGKSDDSTLIKTCCEDGILTKPCPVCGYKYGSAWQTEEVPQEVLEWLNSLPDTEIQPAWV